MRSLPLVFCLPALACAPIPPASDIPVAPAHVTTESSLYVLHLDPIPQPYVAGETAQLRIDVEADGTQVLEATVEVEPWMPDHGHGVTPPPRVAGPDPSFTATWTFSMPGTWELTFTVDGPDGVDTAVVAYVVQ